jgi:RNA polymerase sigma factor (sigma-70 family)
LTKNKAKLNELVTKYKETGITSYFEQAFDISKKQIERTSAKYARNWNIPLEDFISEGNYKFIAAVEIFDGETGDFEHVLNRILRNAFTTLTRATHLKADYTDRYISNDEQTMDLFEDVIISGITKDAAAEAEGLVFADQRTTMIASLLVGASDEMIATVRVYITERSYSKAGEVLGVSHTTVKRRLESLAKKYDTSRFGQVSDYVEGVETIVL